MDLPRSLARDLSAAGFDAVDVRDVSLRGHPDREVHSFAVSDGRALVTADDGLAELLLAAGTVDGTE
jgi:predicted nuclease of predicted toxin-antitoxin system